MKKIIAYIFISSIILTNSVHAVYTPTQDEETKLQNIESKISSVYKKKWIKRITTIKDQINNYIENNRENERTMYFLRIIKNSLVSYIEKDKQETAKKTQIKASEKKVTTTKNSKQSLLDKYGKEISWEISSSCVKHYDFIDSIAKENNFPTELIIAMWKKEHNCHLDNPANGWWAFQIISRYYNPGQISLEEFKAEIIDFINFSKNKIAYYNKDSGKFKAIFWADNIVLTYDNFSIRDLRLYALLYNWIRKTANLETFTFANGNLNSSLKSNSDWIVTSFIKVLKWELDK